MYINSCIPWIKEEEKFLKVVNIVYKIGYQGTIVDFRNQSEYNEFKNSKFCCNKKTEVKFPIDITSISIYKPSFLSIPLIPRVTLTPSSISSLKKDLSKWTQKKILIAVESSNKEILEVAARDGRVDILSLPTIEFQQSLTKGILSLARQNRCFLDISLTPIIECEHFKRTRLLRVLHRLYSNTKPLSNLYTIGSHSGIKKNFMLLRGPKESMAILTSILKVPEFFAKEMYSKNLEDLCLRFIKRDFSLFIEPGVEIIDINKEDD
jgi:RNase P/RNase MRP subunit p30